MKFYVYIYLMILLFVFMVILSVGLFMMDLSILFEWVIFSVNSFMIEFIVLMDWVALMFMGLVLMISSMVLLYSISYMIDDKFINRFFLLVIMFVVSMLLMIMSPSLFSILFGWDMLGLVSYCLVIYYQNYSSYNSGMVTVLSNRVGDVGLLITIGLMLMVGSWNYYLMEGEMLILFMMIVLAAITKSAQMPFSTWLPMAMAAPTPVSSLVHSSTLVTAGVYLIIRFNSLIMLSGMNMYLLFISIFTMIMSGVNALFECDLKKIIALSTLSQLGLMMMVLSLGFNMLGFYHLMTHAVFKSLLFLCAGIIIHLMNGNQDIRLCGGLSNLIPFVNIVFYVSILSMLGCPFLAGFYSKDLIMEFIYILDLNILLFIFMLISLSLTVMYSLRLFYYLFYSDSMSMILFSGVKEDKLMNNSMILLTIMSIMIGSLLNWMFYYSLGGVYLYIYVKFFTVSFILLGMIFLVLFIMVKVKYMQTFWGFMMMMWDLNYIYIFFNNYLFKYSGSLGLIDPEWIESLGVNWLDKFKFNLTSWFYSEFKVFMLVKFYILIFIIILLIY